MNIEQLLAKSVATRPKRPRFTPVDNQVYNAIIHDYRGNIEGQYGTSTAVNMTLDGTTEPVTLWLSGVQQEQFQEFITDKETATPLSVAFARVPKESANGRTYGNLVIAEN